MTDRSRTLTASPPSPPDRPYRVVTCLAETESCTHGSLLLLEDWNKRLSHPLLLKLRGGGGKDKATRTPEVTSHRRCLLLTVGRRAKEQPEVPTNDPHPVPSIQRVLLSSSPRARLKRTREETRTATMPRAWTRSVPSPRSGFCA